MNGLSVAARSENVPAVPSGTPQVTPGWPPGHVLLGKRGRPVSRRYTGPFGQPEVRCSEREVRCIECVHWDVEF